MTYYSIKYIGVFREKFLNHFVDILSEEQKYALGF